MKKFLMVMMATTVAFEVFADSEIVDGIEWHYFIENGSATIGKVDDPNLDVQDVGAGWSAIPQGTSGKITIPSVLGGFPVRRIGRYAFEWCAKITNVTIPSCVTDICDGAFDECAGLKSVTIPEGVESVTQPFARCDNLASISLPNTLRKIVWCLTYACDRIEVINIPANLEVIEWNRWGPDDLNLEPTQFDAPTLAYDCENLRRVTVDPANRHFTIRDGVLYTKDMTQLLTCPDQLTSLNIPASVEKCSLDGLMGNKLKTIAVDPANATYCSIDGMLCDKSGETLLLCPDNWSAVVKVPDGIKKIDYAILGRAVTEVQIPASVNDAESLGYARNLKKIVVDDANPNYASIKGVLYDKRITRLVECPNAMETLELPESIEQLDRVSYGDSSSRLSAIIFRCPPPKLPSWWGGFQGFFDIDVAWSLRRGYYTSYKSEWEKVIANGKWEGLPMQYKPDSGSEGALGTYGPYVPGEKMSMIVGELVGYTAKGLPGGLKLNRNTGEISGTPTKPTESAGASVTFTKKNAETLTARFVVGPFPQLVVETMGAGTVKGAGAYAANKKVSIKASPAKGQVFAGWFVEKDGEGLVALPGTVDYRTPNFSYVMPAHDVTLYAKFADAAEDQVIGLKVGGESVTANADETVFETDGTLVLDVEATSVTVPKVVMSGLPNGLKFTTKLVTSKVTTGSGANRVTTLVTNALPNQIYGSPTKPGTYVVTAKLTNTTVEKAIERKFRIVVDNLTAANGLIRVVDHNGAESSLANARGERYVLTVGVAESVLPARITSSVGTVKVMGLPSGLKYDAKTGSLAGVATKAGTYTVSVTVGKAVSTFTIIVEPLPDWAVGTFGGVIADKCEGELRFYGTIDLSVSTSGKLSAKIAAGGKAYVFSTSGFVSAGERDSYHFKMTTRAGDIYEGTLDAAHYDVKSILSRSASAGDALGEFVPNGQNPYRAMLWRNEHGKDGHISDDETGRLDRTFDAIKSIRAFNLNEWDSAYGNVKVAFKANGATSVSGTASDGTKLSAASFLKLDGPSYHVIADIVVFDKKSGRVYCGAICWEPVFADDGSISGWSECCDHSLLSYPFVR